MDPSETGRATARIIAAARAAAAHVVVADLNVPQLAEEDRHHLVRVLRLRAGEAVSVTDGAGGWRLCHLASGGELAPAADPVWVAAPSPAITVGFAATKGDRPEWAVQKLTELGVDRILLLTTDRGVVRWSGDRGARHVERLALVARQAVMQSRRLFVPVVAGPVAVGEVDGMSPGSGPGGSGGVALAEPEGIPPSLEYPCVLVGPEGGWSREERSGRIAISCSSQILRSETAAVANGVLLTALRAGFVASSTV